MKTPWGEMLRTAARLGVSPDSFWRLSAREWRLMTEPTGMAAPLGRGALEQLVEAWPDDGAV